MKKKKFLALGAALAFAVNSFVSVSSVDAAAQTQTVARQIISSGSEQDISAIKDVIALYAKSIDAANPDMAKDIWQTDERTTFIHPRGNEYGWEDIKADFYGKTMGESFSKRHLDVHDISVQVYGDSAVAVFYWDFPAVFRADGSPITTHGRETQVYERTADGWKIVHVHYSNMPVNGAKAGF